MKMFLLCILTFFTMSAAFAQDATPTPVPAAAVVAPIATVAVAEPAAPPAWAEQLIVSMQSLPVIGPIASKALVYLGIISAILTAFIAFLLTSINALSGVLTLTGLSDLANTILAFKEGKIMYWLKYLSMFNAQKPK